MESESAVGVFRKRKMFVYDNEILRVQAFFNFSEQERSKKVQMASFEVKGHPRKTCSLHQKFIQNEPSG